MNKIAYSTEEFKYYCNRMTAYYAKHGMPFFSGSTQAEKDELQAIIDEGNRHYRSEEGMTQRNLLSVQTKLKSFALTIPGVSLPDRNKKKINKRPLKGDLYELLAKYDSASKIVESTAHRKKEIDREHSVALKEVSVIKKELKKFSGMLRKRDI